ncbi:hypothetical protein [Costertonia aggregata]|uniref:Uncharacterized protein n=1 Tax=Costertonia aggregata TaxID=343403 RepID=A0A7H9ARB4_9FLAO|nr:hypothetical protein [Costertonia aggregata]QLG46031.1 hypothetical protein HYG79_11980 [Costertonia aggregata]
MKTSNKLKRLVHDLNQLIGTIEIIESEIAHALKKYLTKNIEGKAKLRLKTVCKDDGLHLKVYLSIDNKSRLKNVIVPYSASIVEKVQEQIQKQLGI